MREDQHTTEQASYIFSVSKMIRNHICNSLIQLKVNDRNPDCCDLSMAQMNLLLAVRRREELTLSGLAETLKVSPPSCSATG